MPAMFEPQMLVEVDVNLLGEAAQHISGNEIENDAENRTPEADKAATGIFR